MTHIACLQVNRPVCEYCTIKDTLNLPYFSEELSMCVEKTQDKSFIELEEQRTLVKLEHWHQHGTVAKQWLNTRSQLQRQNDSLLMHTKSDNGATLYCCMFQWCQAMKIHSQAHLFRVMLVQRFYQYLHGEITKYFVPPVLEIMKLGQE